MPAALSYPGVYIEEIPSGVRTITGVATSITAFLGRAARGPVDEPVTINSYGDFERRFGGLWAESPLGFAVRDFYLNGGGQAVIVRMYDPVFSSKADQAAAKAAALATVAATTGADLAAAKAAAANKADDYTTEPEKKAAEAVSDAVAEAADAPGATLETVAAAAAKAAAAAAPLTKASVKHSELTIEAKDEGAWGNSLRIRVDHDVIGDDTANTFNLSIWDGQTKQTELFRNVSIAPGHIRRVDLVLENESRLVRVIGALPAAKPAAHAKFEPPMTDIWADNSSATNAKVSDSDKASDGDRLEQSDFDGPGKESAKAGLFALEKVDLFNILCIPPHGDGNDVETTLWGSAAAYCEKRRAFLLVDPPANWKGKDAAKMGNANIGTVSKNAALYFPRLKQPNSVRDNRIEDFVPCGALAGVFARTDSTRGVWKAPAGIDATIVGAIELSVPLTDPENGELNQLGINCLRTMPAAGRIVWGSRTRQGDDRLASEWKYIPVRRTALFIEESLYRGTQWVVFEPNDEPLWSQIRLNLGAFMNNLFRQGAFQGKTPAEAYFVKCDKETTTQNDINLGVVNIIVGFAPLKPAEFVVIKLQQIAGQIQT
jgi:uncharacterized protein